MKKSLPPIIVVFIASLFLCSCETTLDYGYFIESLNDESIETLFIVSDESTREQDFATYSGLLGPDFSSVDASEGRHSTIYRHEYLNFVEDVFKSAKYIDTTTVIMDIQIIEAGRKAIVQIQEEERRKYLGIEEHFTKILDVEIGYEDGWVYFEKFTLTAIQVIKG